MTNKKIPIIVLILITVITCIGFSENTSRFLLAEGSDCMMQMFNISILYQLLSLALIFFVFFFRKILKKFYASMLILSILLWLLSGRVIGHFPFPEEKIVSGWFYIQTSQTYFCNYKKNNCEEITNETLIEKKPFWFIHIKNQEVDKSIFVGPFLWNNVTNYLDKKQNF
jgi:hypothetical protein